MYDRNDIEAEYWIRKLKDCRWEEVFRALDLGFKRGRGGKYYVRNVGCSECCSEEDSLVCYRSGIVMCRACKLYAGDMLDFIGHTLDCLYIPVTDSVTDEDIESVITRLPRIEDRRQMWLFSPKWFRLGYYTIPCG